MTSDFWETIKEAKSQLSMYIMGEGGNEEFERELESVIARYSTWLDKPDGPGWWWRNELPVYVYADKRGSHVYSSPVSHAICRTDTLDVRWLPIVPPTTESRGA